MANYFYKSRTLNADFSLKDLVTLTPRERGLLKADLEEAITGMRQKMYQERYNVDESDPWFKAISYKLNLCSQFYDELEAIDSLGQDLDKVHLAFLEKELEVVMGEPEAKRIIQKSGVKALAHVKQNSNDV
jgi:hypothetical protein